MTLDFNQRVTAIKRVARLNDKLYKINMLLAVRAHSGHPNDIETRKLLKKDQKSTLASLKRWEKKLGVAQ